jgi:hypothetical protein
MKIKNHNVGIAWSAVGRQWPWSLPVRYDNVTLSPLLLPARVTNRSHSTYGSSAQSDSHRAVFCPNSVVSGWKN